MPDDTGDERVADVCADLARERWGDDFVRPSRSPSTEEMPSLDVVAEKTAAVFTLAQEELESRLSTRIRMWEDGEFEVRVWHSYGPYGGDTNLRALLRYHSRDGDIEGGVTERCGDERRILHRETLTVE